MTPSSAGTNTMNTIKEDDLLFWGGTEPQGSYFSSSDDVCGTLWLVSDLEMLVKQTLKAMLS
jgi:hypothetical protein